MSANCFSFWGTDPQMEIPGAASAFPSVSGILENVMSKDGQ